MWQESIFEIWTDVLIFLLLLLRFRGLSCHSASSGVRPAPQGWDAARQKAE